MDSDAEGVPSEFFDYFKVLTKTPDFYLRDYRWLAIVSSNFLYIALYFTF